LHSALRSILGEHVVQKGSHVGADRLRFDFTYPKPLTAQEIQAIEAYVNQNIVRNKQAETHIMNHQEAINKGAVALFGEKYNDHVRVVSLGQDGVSMELCGGTHVHATGDIGAFKILSEAGIASGIRRIEAITGQRVIHYIHELEEQNNTLQHQLREETLALNKQITKLKQQIVFAHLDTFDEEYLDQNNIKWALKTIQDVPAKELRVFADHIVQKQKDAFVLLLCSIETDKISLMIATSKHTPSHIDASKLIQLAVPYIGGKGGGGKPNMAQGGGHDTTKLKTLLQFLTRTMQEDTI
ncbi:MAG: DHHA1 domain-containing protein, partial [Alphaproteobacteria bacterium]|nr:DHHA1 domain-containing protein [Alphaproteobacteria bacterium]